jgi:hypothetical protein
MACDRLSTNDENVIICRYNLGPNGAIVTSLNLFTTKFDQVLEIISKRAPTLEYVSQKPYANPHTILRCPLTYSDIDTEILQLRPL